MKKIKILQRSKLENPNLELKLKKQTYKNKKIKKY